MLQRMQRAVAPILSKIYQHPFTTQLAQGSLPKEIFQHYTQQDNLYLHDFSTALSLTASRLKNNAHAKVLNTARTTAIQNELTAHNHYLNGSSFRFFHPSLSLNKSEVIDRYTRHLLVAANEAPVGVALSCLLPCFYIYRELGHQMHSFVHPSHPYRQWIESCSSQKYRGSTQAIIDITAEYYTAASDTLRLQMVNSFKESTDFELVFFDECFYRKSQAKGAFEHQEAGKPSRGFKNSFVGV